MGTDHLLMDPNVMNSAYQPMFMNYQNDQFPSTSTLQQRQVFEASMQNPFGYRPSSANPMVRVAGLKANHMNHWMNEHVFAAPNFNYSPAQSEMSCASGMSMNSFMSGMSRLTINTNISYHTSTYQNIAHSNPTSSMGPPSNENLRPLNIEEVSSKYNFVLEQLKQKDFFEKETNENNKVFDSLYWLVHERLRGRKLNELIEMRQRLPFHLFTQEMADDLVKAMFARLMCNMEKQNQMSRQQTQVWEDRVYHLLKNLFVIITVFNNVFDNALDNILYQIRTGQGTVSPFETIYLLLFRPGRQFTYYAVIVARLLLFPTLDKNIKENTDPRRIRYRQRMRKQWKQGKFLEYLMEALVAIVTHEDLNLKAKTAALDVITNLIGRSEARSEFLNKSSLNRLIKKCLHQNAEVDLILQMTGLLLKMTTPAKFPPHKDDENKKMFYYFMKQFMTFNGFQAIASMLNHGHPRILIRCLLFLSEMGGIGVDDQLREPVSLVLKLVCSSEPTIVQACLQCLCAVSKNSPILKQLTTSKRGPKMIIQVLCSEFKMSTENINAYGTHLLCQLLASDNPSASEAAEQLSEDPQTAPLVIFHLSRQNLDNSCQELLLMLKTMHALAPQRTVEILKQRNRITLFEAIAFTVFQIRFVDEKENGKQELLTKIIAVAMELIIHICREKEVAELFSIAFGKIQVERDCPISLFTETKNKALIKDLLKFLFFLTSEHFSSSLQSLPKIWAKHSNFSSLMHSFCDSSDLEVSEWAKQLLMLSGV